MHQGVKFDLRPWTTSDLGSLVNYANNQRIAQNMTDKFPYPYTETDGLSFIDFATADSPVNIFAIAVAGEAVGGIGVHPQTDIHRKNAELGYWLAEPFWGQGIISAAIKQAVDYAFDTYDINRVFARPFGTNAASQRVLQKNGFVLEGHFRGTLYKNGAYVDELVYALRRQNWEKGQRSITTGL
jgi:RimJ/RimL family protein N-acetyltransferase